MRVGYDYNKVASTYDKLDDGALAKYLGFSSLRQELISSAEGTVLECGVGTGVRRHTALRATKSTFIACLCLQRHA